MVSKPKPYDLSIQSAWKSNRKLLALAYLHALRRILRHFVEDGTQKSQAVSNQSGHVPSGGDSMTESPESINSSACCTLIIKGCIPS